MQSQLGLVEQEEQFQIGDQAEILQDSQQQYQLEVEVEEEIVTQQIHYKVQLVVAEVDLVLQQTAPWLEA
jgi:actin-like ATPase involved in cell morphogenesis